MDDPLYREEILEHSRNPRNKRVIEGATISAPGSNPSCGDSLILYMNIENGLVKDAAFTGEGCALSQASASMLTEHIKGKTTGELKLLVPGDVYSILNVDIGPARAQCVLLSYGALEEALKKI